MNPLEFLEQSGHQGSDANVSIENYLVVSNEGIFQSIGDVFRNIRHGRPPKLIDDRGTPRLNKKQLEATYLNPEWLGKRRAVEGEVKVSQFGKPFMDGNYVKAMRALADHWVVVNKKNRAITVPYYEKVKPGFEFVNNYDYKNAEKLAAFLAEFKLDYTAPKFEVIGKEYDISRDGATLPALSKEQVVTLVKAIVYMGDSFFDNSGYNTAWERDFGTTLNKRWYLYSNTGAKILADATFPRDIDSNRNCFKLINDIYDYSVRFEGAYYKRPCIGYNTFYNWLRGAIAWIDASIK